VAPSHYASDSVTSRTAIGAGWMIAWRLVTRGLGLISTLILARLLVPADFGIVAVASAFAAGVEALSELGLQAALVRRPDDDESLYDTAFTMQAIRGVTMGTILASGAWMAGNLFGDPRLTPVLLVLAGIAAVAGLDNVAVVRFQRELRFDMEFRLLFLPRILQFVAATTAAITLRSYWALIIGIVVGRLSRTCVTYWIQPHRPRLSLSRWRDLAGFSFWSWASSMAYLVWNRFDAFVLGPALGMGQLGIFMLAMEIGLLPTTELVEPATRALYAGVSAAQNRGTDAIGLALPLIAVLQMVVVPIGLGISATSSYVVAGLLGPAWASGDSVIAIFSTLAIVTPTSYVCATILNAAGHVRQNFFAVAGASALRVAALYSVAGYHRLDWAAVAICCVVAAESLLFLFQLSRRGRLRWRDVAPGAIRTAASSSCIATVLWITGLGWRSTNLSWAAALFAGCAIGAACIVGCGALQVVFWLWCGRPNGPEATLLTIAGGFLARLRRLAA
jgi:lipopolysaccharide exporter